ncbi:SUKH-3 domain-containing protein [Solwaraspora sp. WMMB335]|uniref:SUKH-3 domain-containing protein n=1 Tax=Solwaraspora sp. WMMB335 TaxID=3404118 RepID=UPI003B9454D1
MIDRDEALAMARGWAGEHGTAPDVGLHEFDQGYVAWPIGSTPGTAATAGAPGSSGPPRIVIDRQTGEMTQWPPLPVAVIAQRYATERAADRRFPPDVRHVLETAGWFPGRDVTPMIDRWRADWAAELDGLVMTPAARTALTEFGGLTFPQFGADGEADAGFPTFVHPVRGGLVTEEARVFIDEYDHQVFPLGGNSDGPSELVIDADQRVFMLHWAGYLFVAAGIDAALTALIRGGPFPPARPGG